MRPLWLACLLILVACSSPPATKPGAVGFVNDQATRWASGPVLAVAVDGRGEAWAATEQGLLQLVGGSWESVSSEPVQGLAVHSGEVWRLTARGLQSGEERWQPPAEVDALLGGEALAAACADGLYVRGTSGWSRAPAPPGTVIQLAQRAGRWAAATSAGLFERNAGDWTLVPGAPAKPSGVAYDRDGALWIAAPSGLHRRATDGWRAFAGNDGLPWIGGVARLTSGPEGTVWLATDRGAVRWDPARGFSYRQGPRWLPDDRVHQVVVDAAGIAWFATEGGVARLAPQRLTLAEKAARFEAAIERHHRRTEFGFVEAVRLERPGDLSAWTQRDSDNDGLWTAMFGAGQCFAYAATRDPAHAERARQAFRALAFLSEVPQGSSHPPPPGFPARTVLPTDGPDPNPHYTAERDRQRRRARDPLWKVLQPRWPVSADGRWYWKTDTSSDELDGHLFFYAQFFDLVADDAERAEVARVVTRIVDHLRDHGWRLVDHDGQPTRWANFAPESLNDDPTWSDERGLNSLSLLSYLAVAHHVSGDPSYAADAARLIAEHGYAENLGTPKVHQGPGTGNQSDDEMAFMSFYNLLRLERDAELRARYLRAFHGYWELERPEANPLFHFLFAAVARDAPAELVAEARETLERFPLDRVEWSYQNSHRLDVVRHAVDPGEGRPRGHLRGGRVLPIDERFVDKWNTDPWRLDSHGDGRTLADGNAFLLPYYLGKHLGLLE